MNNPQPWWLTWPVAEVAVAILPCFSYQPHQDQRIAMYSVLNWCKTGSISSKGYSVSPLSGPFEHPDFRAIAEAIQVLEHTGLLMRTFGGDWSNLGLTRLGMHALQTNTVRQHLGLSDAPPTA